MGYLKNMTLTLYDGNIHGRIRGEISGWNGLVYRLPRNKLSDSLENEELDFSGIYFLFGTTLDTGAPIAYIGQAGSRKNGNGLINRLQEHSRNQKKDYWNEAILFSTLNNSYGATELNYLENYFYNKAKKFNNYIIDNNIEPNLGNISTRKKLELEEYVDFYEQFLELLGHSILIPKENDYTEPLNKKSFFNSIKSIPSNLISKNQEGLHLYFKGVGKKIRIF